MKFDIAFIQKETGAKLLSQPVSGFDHYSTDNRDLKIARSLFIPLVGENHDAHDFVEKAILAGATGVLLHKWDDGWETYKDRVSFLQVADTLVAIQSLAKAWRQQCSAKVLALTGSNGKTTTKDFLSQLLGSVAATSASHGSFNNHWGVPFTLLNLEKKDEYCVVEMGMNHAGEIAALNEIVCPDLVTVTNVGRAHMGNFENGIQGVALAKEEIYQTSPKASQFIFNVDNEWTIKMYEKYTAHPSYTFSRKDFSADVFLRVKQKTSTGFILEGQIGGEIGSAPFQVWGEHNIENLAASVCLAYVAGVQPAKLWSLIEKCHTGWGRNQWLKTKSGASILFDGYNANPDSFQQLVNNLASLFGHGRPMHGFFGEMLELGEQTAVHHKKLGEQLGQLPWDSCVFIGPSGAAFQRGWGLSQNNKKPVILNSYEESLDLQFDSMLNEKSFVIVKGSRGGALERLVHRMEPISFPPK